MINKLLAIVLLAAISTVNAQDKTVALKFQEKHKYAYHGFTDNGTVYVVTANPKGSKPNADILCFDADLNSKFSKNIPTEFKGLPAFFGRGMSTPQVFYDLMPIGSGEHALSFTDKLLFDTTGNSKKWDVDTKTSFEDFDTKFSIFTDNNACYFGKAKEGDKKKKESNEAFFYRVNFSDFSKSLFELEFQEFPSLIKGEKEKKKNDDTKENWEIGPYNSKQFFMINKRTNENRTEDQYNIMSFDYEGEVVGSWSIPLKLKAKYFALSDTGFGNKTFMYSDMVSVGLMGSSGTGNIYVEGDNEFFYIYGLYSNKNASNLNKVDYNGFYIYKFNAKGELIWKTEKSIVDEDGFNKTQRPIAVTVNFNLLKTNEISFSISSFYEKYVHLFLLDSKEGKILKSKKPEIKIEGNRLEGISGGAFATGYAVDGGFEKKHFDLNALVVAYLSPKVNAYLKTPSKDDLNYNCKITKDAIYMIEENYKDKTLRLLKFDW